MSAKPRNPQQSDLARDLPLKEEQAKDVQGGKSCAAGEHIKEGTITVRK